MEGVRIPVDETAIAGFCRRRRVKEFALYGSVLRDDFRPDSDVDVLVTFEPGHERTLDDFLSMVGELRRLFGREIDLCVRSTMRNPFMRHHVPKTRRVVHVA